jgi:hypothetical protein
MKKLTRERVVPIISASVSWLIFAMSGIGLDFETGCYGLAAIA